MSLRSSGIRARSRKSLSFEDAPYSGKTFYIDVRSANVKTKITQKILSLGGQIETFLSKSVSLLITDNDGKSNSQIIDATSTGGKAVPLSRGQALLMKAVDNQESDSHTNASHGILQSAANLGLQTQTSSAFLREASRLLAKLKVKAAKYDKDPMCGMSPITWDSEKENGSVLKVEDMDDLYRPLFKQFETFPQIFYNDSGSPFDVGVVLTKPQENTNQSTKKKAGGVLRGGYCESCDHWYKCSLREHLNSDKHQEFILTSENFKSLDKISEDIPNMNSFVAKYGFKTNFAADKLGLNSKTFANENQERTHFQCESLVGLSNDLSQQLVQSIIISDSSQIAVCNDEVKHHLEQSSIYVANENSREIKITKTSEKSERAVHHEKKLSIDDVLKSVTNNYGLEMSKDEKEYDAETCQMFEMTNNSVAASRFSNAAKSLEHVSINDPKSGITFLPSIYDRNSEITENGCVKKLNINNHKHDSAGSENVIRDYNENSKNNPEAAFSSSSCSFGDNGVSNVLTFLNSQRSNHSSGKPDGFKGGAMAELANYKHYDRDAFSRTHSLEELGTTCDKLLENINTTESYADTCEIDTKKVLSNDGIHLHEKRSVGIRSDRNLFNTFEMPVHKTDPEDILQESLIAGCKSGNSPVIKPDISTFVFQPEYSNITEESFQEKPLHVKQKNVSSVQQENTDLKILDFDSDMFGNDCNTPVRLQMEKLKTAIYGKQANSGSTIRNWLLPNDITNDVSPSGNLNETLVNTSIEMVDQATENMRNDKPVANCTLKEIEESAETSKVADWIRNQEFGISNCENENSNQGTGIHISDVETCKLELDIPDDFEDLLKQTVKETKVADCFNEIEIKSERKLGFDGQREDNIVTNSNGYWSESGTSISDCTLDDLKVGTETGINNLSTICEPLDKENIVPPLLEQFPDNSESRKIIEQKKALSQFDEVSRDFDSVSIKSGLSSVVTSRGIKITGLSALNVKPPSSFDSGICSDASIRTESKTMTILSDEKKADSITKEVMKNEAFANNEDISKTKEVNFTSNQTEFSSLKQSSVHLDNQAFNQHNNCEKGKKKGKPESQKKRQTKPRKPKSEKAVKSQQLQPQKLLTQVLSQNVYSPISPASANNNHFNEQASYPMIQTNSQTYHSSYNFHQQNGYYFQQGCGSTYQNHNIPMHVNTSQPPTLLGDVDFLLSPSQQQQNWIQQQVNFTTNSVNNYPTSYSETLPDYTAQSHSYVNRNFEGNSCINSIASDVNTNFLSSHSNFLMENWYTGVNLHHQENHCTQQVPVSEKSNFPASSGLHSHNDAMSDGTLHTVDISQIEDNGNVFENNFRFNIANTHRMKDSNKLSKRNGQYDSPNIQIPSTSNNYPVSSVHWSSKGADLSNITSHSSIPLIYSQPNYSMSSPIACPAKPNEHNTQFPSWANNVQYPTSSHNYNPPLNHPVTSYNQNNSTSVPQNLNYSHANNETSHQQGQGSGLYNLVQTGDTRLTFRRMPMQQPSQQCEEPKHNLTHYWNVRKAGDCRLVFSANVIGKRKAEETPTKCDNSPYRNEDVVQDDYSPDMDGQQHIPKRRRCLVY